MFRIPGGSAPTSEGKSENSEEQEFRGKIMKSHVLVPENPFSSSCLILLTCKMGVNAEIFVHLHKDQCLGVVITTTLEIQNMEAI